MNVIRLSSASPTEDLRALQEVSNFATTDMGWGGKDKWTYRILSEEQVMPELLRISQHGTKGNVDYVTLQPCTSYEARSQDRLIVQTWDMPDGQWTFSGIFDGDGIPNLGAHPLTGAFLPVLPGHGSHNTVEFVLEHLPAQVRTMLRSTLSNGSAPSAAISHVLSDAIIEIDCIISRNFLRLFPGGRERLARLGDQEIASILRRQGEGTPPPDVLRCMQGSTALITLIDPTGSRLWIANLGDCRAVLISRRPNGSYDASRMSDIHNGSNEHERRRIRDEHPGEEECVISSRVLGYLAPTRALGDTWAKLPPIYSRRVLMRTKQFWSSCLSEEHINRIKTPPYVSNVPQVCYRRLRGGSTNSSRAQVAIHNHREDEDIALLLCSDGLVDLYEDQNLREDYYLRRWATTIGEAMALQSSLPHCHSRSPPPTTHGDRNGSQTNLAVHLLRDAIGGDDIHRVSANLTVEMDERWMDDTTMIVHRLC